ncbi:MAG: hypothetical protein KDL87_11020, partial [Verrucomicrobiae bacterium]|nr:hypothetical protein [Verrucomicrobiae bacterium]
VRSDEDDLVEPNLPRLHAICGTPAPAPFNGANVDRHRGNGGHPPGQPWTGIGANVDTPRGDGGQDPVLKGTEGLRTEVFSESLSEYLTERTASGDFNPGEILTGNSVQQYRERRAINFGLTDLKPEWASLGFDKLAEADEAQAAALLELAEKMPTGERPAICFPNNTDLSRALTAVLLGHWIDTHVGEGFHWVNVQEFSKVVAGDFSDARTALIASVQNPDGPLVIENLGEARKHQQAREALEEAIKQHENELMPVVFLGLPPRLSDLSNSLKGHTLADTTYRILKRRNQPLDRETGLDISNPFKDLL